MNTSMDIETKSKLFSDAVKVVYKEESVALHAPVFTEQEERYVVESIKSTYVSYVGKFVDAFEKNTAEFSGAKYAVATVNGTSALHTALIISGVSAGDEVITQALTFVATANAIAYCGAHPIFIDVDIDTMGMSPDALKNFLNKHTETKGGVVLNKTTGRRIGAVMPMHTFGIPCRINEIRNICLERGITLIEDSAEALGSYSNGTHVGTFGDIGAFSFNANKIITSGGGGMIITNNETLAMKAAHITKTSKQTDKFEFFHDQIGYNYRLPNLNAAVGLAQLEKLPKFLQIKSNLAKKWHAFFSELGIQVLTCLEGDVSNNWLIPLKFRSVQERNIFLEKTNAEGVMTRPIWTPMNELPMFDHCYSDNLENSKKLAKTIVNIPSGIPKHLLDN